MARTPKPKQSKNGKPIGKPLKFGNPEQLQSLIDAYFRECIEQERPFTITGLALALDTTVKTLAEYEQRDGYGKAVKKAKLRVQKHVEENALLGRYAAAFSIFWMKNNAGWKDKQDVDHTGDVKLTVNYVDTGSEPRDTD